MMIARGLAAGRGRRGDQFRKADACEQAVAALSEFGSVRGVPARICPGRTSAPVGRRDHRPLDILVNNAGATWVSRWRPSPRRHGTGSWTST